MKRVLYHVFTPTIAGHDGISTAARQAVRALRSAEGVEVEVISLVEPAGQTVEKIDSGVRCRLAGRNRKRFVRWAVAAACAWSRPRGIVMHVNLLPALLPYLLRGGRLTVIMHGVEVWRPMKPLQALALRLAWKVVAVSDYTRRQFYECNPALAGVPIEVCHHGRRIQSEVSPEHPAKPPYALIVGRLASERYKGHDPLLDAWPELLARCPEARLVVAGDGDDRARLEAKARALGLNSHVEFVGEVPDDVLAALYRDCAFLAMPSRGEGFGLVYLEAMFAGKPCIGAPGAAAEVIEHGQTGLIVDPESPAELLAALKMLFGDEALRRQMGEAGKRRAYENFTEAHFRERFLRLFGLTPATNA